MEILINLITRFRQTGVLFLIGLLLIMYIAFGFVYFQQGTQQKEFEEQITKLNAIVARKLPSSEELQAQYDEVNSSLAPMSDSAAIARLVSIAEESGIDVGEESGKFRVPSAAYSQVQKGGGTYQLTSFKNIRVQGDYDNIQAFLSDLDSGRTLEIMVLTRVVLSEIEVVYTGTDAARRAEFRSVESAVARMMADTNPAELPNPITFSDGVATNLMGDDPETIDTVEGFPDITTTAAERGYTGIGSPRDGYVLYGHDKISTTDTTSFEAVNYIDILTTQYYYVCSPDGTVRQFSGPNVATAIAYLSSVGAKIETVASVDVEIYTKP